MPTTAVTEYSDRFQHCKDINKQQHAAAQMKMAARSVRRESHNYYAVLGLPESATATDIRVAYKRKALTTHPDKGGSSADFRLVVKAFEVLFSGRSRASYDAKLQAQTCQARSPCERRCPAERVRSCEAVTGRSPVPRHSTLSKIKGRKSKSEKLERCLRQLQRILQECPQTTRLEQIQGMSQVLRTSLLDFMEKSKHEHICRMRQSNGLTNGPQSHEGLDIAAPGQGRQGEKEGRPALPEMNDVEQPFDETASADPSAKPDHSAGSARRPRLHKNLNLLRGIYSIAAKSQVYYESRIVHRNFCMASRVSRSLEDVINYHTILAVLRQRMVELEEIEPDSSFDEPAEVFNRLKGTMLRAMQEVEGLTDMGLSFQVVVDARPWIGKMLYSPRMHCAKTALEVWQRAETVRLVQGWVGIKAVWSQWMQAERRSCWTIRRRSPQEAEAMVRRAECLYSAAQRKQQLLRKKREAAQERRQAELAEREKRRNEREKKRQRTVQKRIECLVQIKLTRCVRRAEVLIKSLLAKERSAHSAQRPRFQAHRQVSESKRKK